jgi:DUF4097 and DUF4098 domain-containing protein YvlB
MNSKRWLVVWLGVTLALIVIGHGLAHAEEWKVVDDDGWCKGGGRCEVREITLTGWDDIRVRTVNGNIDVETWDKDEIRVLAKITVKGSDREETMEKIEIRTEDHEIRASGPRDHGGFLGMFGGRSWSVSYRVMVPRDTDVGVHTTNGDIEVAGVAGDVDFGSVNGAVRLLEVGGDVRGGTTNGSVKVALAMEGWEGDEVDLNTVNGGVKIDLPADFSARLDLATTNGGIRVEHPVTVERDGRHRLRGTIGDGGDTVVRARTTNGGVHIYRLDV